MELLRNIDVLLVTDPVNVLYLTGFIGLTRSEREAYVLVTPATLYLFTHALYLEQAKKIQKSSVNNQSFSTRVSEISREDPLSKRLKELFTDLFHARSMKSIKLGFEATNLTYAEYQILKKELSDVDLVPLHDRVELLRQIKRPDEITHIKRAAQLTDKCFNYVIKQLKPGITESDIAWEIELFFHKNGVESAFPPIVAFNAHSSQPHYVPKQGVSLKGYSLVRPSLVLLDFGARVNGYCADMTRVVFMGKPTLKLRQVYETVLNAQLTAIDSLIRTVTTAIAQGSLAQGFRTTKISGAALDRTARAYIEKAGFPAYPHSLGHNVGLAIHENPRLTIKRDKELNPGMVFTIEPAIYLEGKFGIRIEDLVVLKEDGIEVLSKSPKKFTIITL